MNKFRTLTPKDLARFMTFLDNVIQGLAFMKMKSVSHFAQVEVSIKGATSNLTFVAF